MAEHAESHDTVELSDEPFELTAPELEEAQAAESDVSPISYSGTDFDVDGLVRRLDRGDIVIPNFGHTDDQLELAGFQRGFVWRRPQMDRFIESLLLGFPIPAIMLVLQTDKRYLVLDGQQRLKTLQDFYGGIHRAKEFSLVNVADQFKGLTYKKLTEPQRRTLDNTFIQATIVRSDGSSKSLDSIYQVFERLNSGGTQLTPHEIRIALYSGPMVTFLSELNSDPAWRRLYGPPSPRLRDQEVVLRILALFSRSNEYFAPLKKFLNQFMNDHRDLSAFPRDEADTLFRRAVSEIEEAGGRDSLRRSGQRVNAALVETVVAVYMTLLKSGTSLTPEQLSAALSILSQDSTLESASSSSTTTEENVRIRIARVSQFFSDARVK